MCKRRITFCKQEIMAKRTSKKSGSKHSPSRAPEASMPGPHFMEQIVRGFLGDDDKAGNAQEHAYNAMEAMANEDWDRAHREAMKAIKLDPNCVDALTVMSQMASENKQELIDNLRRTVDRAETALGKRFIKENEGWFWGLLETRPYMRARAQLAGLLHDTGQIEEAIEHFEDMLRLNPGDNQGLRYSLLGCYLAKGHVEGAERLFAAYPEEGSAMFAWARVLTDFLSGKQSSATKSLSAARQTNRHVEPLLTGQKKMPKDGPAYYSPGDPSEAVICMREIGSAWASHAAAIEWLKQQKPKRKPPRSPRAT